MEEKVINYQILKNFKKLIDIYPKLIDELKAIISNEITKRNGIQKFNENYEVNILTFPVKEMTDKIENIDIISLELNNQNNIIH